MLVFFFPMPPKKDAKKKKESADAAPPLDPSVDLKSLTVVTDMLANVQQLRQYYQLERDKVHKFWEITLKELDNNKHQLLNADQELEDLESRHQVEIKVYKQKVRHLLYEHKLQVQEIRMESDKALQQATAQHQETMEKLLQEKYVLHKDIQTSLQSHETAVSDTRDSHKYMLNVTKKQNHDKEMGRLQASYESKLNLLRNELELRRRAEIHEIEERKNEHINELIKLHERKFSDMKAYYNQITTNNLDLIKSLKEEIANMKKNDEHNENLMYDIEKENHNLSEPLELAKKEVAELQQQLNNYEKDKLSLRNTRSRLRALDAEYRQLQEDQDRLQMKFSEVLNDRDNLKDKFEAALQNAMDVVQERNATLYQQLVEVSSKVEERDAQLTNVLAAVNLEPTTLEIVTRELEDKLETKNRAIKDLHFELKKIEKQHKDVVSEYERRLMAKGIPVLNLAEIV